MSLAINCRWRSIVARSIVTGDQLSLDQLSLAINCRSINCRWRSIVVRSIVARSIVAGDQLSLAINCRWRSIVADPFNNEFIVDPILKVNGFGLPGKVWVTLIRVRTYQGRCNATLHKWNMVDSPKCGCGAFEQSIPHIVLFWST